MQEDTAESHGAVCLTGCIDTSPLQKARENRRKWREQMASQPAFATGLTDPQKRRYRAPLGESITSLWSDCAEVAGQAEGARQKGGPFFGFPNNIKAVLIVGIIIVCDTVCGRKVHESISVHYDKTSSNSAHLHGFS